MSVRHVNPKQARVLAGPGKGTEEQSNRRRCRKEKGAANSRARVEPNLLLQRIQECQQIAVIGRIQSLKIGYNCGCFAAVAQNRRGNRSRAVVVHQATRSGEGIGQAPQRRRSPHGESGLTGILRLEGNAPRVSRSHIVKQEVGVNGESNVAQRSDS